MKSKLVLKRLTRSDLTFFEWHFRNNNASNQKAINLNKDVFIDQLYPSAPDVAAHQLGRLPLDLTILGPGAAEPVNVQRKIVKNDTYKNWRLNGEYVPISIFTDPKRFNNLQEGDFALFEFVGLTVPISAKLILVGQAYTEDVSVFRHLNRLAGSQKMLVVTSQQLTEIAKNAAIPNTHPVNGLILDEEQLQNFEVIGEVPFAPSRAPSVPRIVSREELQKARQNLEETGRLGEVFVYHQITKMQQQGQIEAFVWSSNINAVSPFDFEVNTSTESFLLDVKSTTREFERPLHISLSELKQMADTSRRYALYRVYKMTEKEAYLRILHSTNSFAQGVLEVLKTLPAGTISDGIVVDPTTLEFGNEQQLTFAEDVD